ncbi:hypothetical protein [Gimesia chilikensis]|uniref:hypothetical protein n=1 Tax=Gimesia chilikensis TaxID=2605989 RepID=UPI003A92694D
MSATSSSFSRRTDSESSHPQPIFSRCLLTAEAVPLLARHMEQKFPAGIKLADSQHRQAGSSSPGSHSPQTEF